METEKSLLPRLDTYIIIKELACFTEVFSHTNTTVYTVLLNLKEAEIKNLSYTEITNNGSAFVDCNMCLDKECSQ